MLLIENITYRYREWRDRATTENEPDLVDRYKRLWREPVAAEERHAARAGLSRRLISVGAVSDAALR